MRPESSLQVLLLFRDDDVVDERHRAAECGQQPQAVDRDREYRVGAVRTLWSELREVEFAKSVFDDS